MALSGDSDHADECLLLSEERLLFGKATSLGGDFAFPAPSRHAFVEQRLAFLPALWCVVVGLFAVREANLLALRAGAGKRRRCHRSNLKNSNE